MGAATSMVEHTKVASAYEVTVNRELLDAVRAHPDVAATLQLSNRTRPLEGTLDYQITSRGPPPGNDLLDLFLARLPEEPTDESGEPTQPAAPPTRQQAQRKDHAQWRLVRDATSVACKLLKALQGLHSLGFAHGDVKPENAVMLEGRVQLIDFGQTSRLGDGRWAEANTALLNVVRTSPTRWVGQPVELVGPDGEIVLEVRMSPPTVLDDMFRACTGFHRLVSELDPETARQPAWPDSLMFGPDGGLGRLLEEARAQQAQSQPAQPTETVAQMCELVHMAAMGDMEAEKRLVHGLGCRRISPGTILRLRVAVVMGRMMIACFNVAAVCAPTQQHKAQAWQIMTDMFAPSVLEPRQSRRQSRQQSRQQSQHQTRQQSRPQQSRQQSRPQSRQQSRPHQQIKRRRPLDQRTNQSAAEK
jgi:hypothetical protein